MTDHHIRPGTGEHPSEERPRFHYRRRPAQAHIAKREKETGRQNPIYTNLDWHGKGCGPFKTSQQAYDSMYIGSIVSAQKLQAANKPDRNVKEQQTQRGAKL